MPCQPCATAFGSTQHCYAFNEDFTWRNGATAERTGHVVGEVVRPAADVVVAQLRSIVARPALAGVAVELVRPLRPRQRLVGPLVRRILVRPRGAGRRCRPLLDLPYMAMPVLPMRSTCSTDPCFAYEGTGHAFAASIALGRRPILQPWIHRKQTHCLGRRPHFENQSPGCRRCTARRGSSWTGSAGTWSSGPSGPGPRRGSLPGPWSAPATRPQSRSRSLPSSPSPAAQTYALDGAIKRHCKFHAVIRASRQCDVTHNVSCGRGVAAQALASQSKAPAVTGTRRPTPRPAAAVAAGNRPPSRPGPAAAELAAARTPRPTPRRCARL